MAKVTMTITDLADNSLGITIEADPPMPLTNGELDSTDDRLHARDGGGGAGGQRPRPHGRRRLLDVRGRVRTRGRDDHEGHQDEGRAGVNVVTVWIDHDTLSVRRDDLGTETVDLLPPEVEARVESILREARYDIIWFNRHDGPLGVSERDLEAICLALDTSGALWRNRPPASREVPERGRVAVPARAGPPSCRRACWPSSTCCCATAPPRPATWSTTR
jgi:hypothetical protein